MTAREPPPQRAAVPTGTAAREDKDLSRRSIYLLGLIRLNWMVKVLPYKFSNPGSADAAVQPNDATDTPLGPPVAAFVSGLRRRRGALVFLLLAVVGAGTTPLVNVSVRGAGSQDEKRATGTASPASPGGGSTPEPHPAPPAAAQPPGTAVTSTPVAQSAGPTLLPPSGPACLNVPNGTCLTLDEASRTAYGLVDTGVITRVTIFASLCGTTDNGKPVRVNFEFDIRREQTTVVEVRTRSVDWYGAEPEPADFVIPQARACTA